MFFVRRVRKRRVVRRRRKAVGVLRYAATKEQTRELVTRLVEQYNAHYKFPVGRIAIRNQRSRWGSCSKKGNLNFNFRLAELPSHLAEYIVVHELCHIGEFNHSRNFWKLVEETIPDWQERRYELRVQRIR